MGLIQFGPAERKQLNINPAKDCSWDRQMPKVVVFFKSRGFDGSNYKNPLERQKRLYNTVLGGNPNANMSKKDTFGTSVNKVAASMHHGPLRARAKRFLQSA